MPLMKTVRPNGAEIRRRREALGYNGVQFAELVGTNQSWLSQIELEREDAHPSAALYGRICQKLNADWDELLHPDTAAPEQVA